ncbi:MAG: hypothetical protein ATN36_09015 [Epulopiscium sp. Nele67-Bin005]|nr:MAG: hypothetical protein ATN36_09015 [Epulopiscium sp. Nele67-Bin005]
MIIAIGVLISLAFNNESWVMQRLYAFYINLALFFGTSMFINLIVFFERADLILFQTLVSLMAFWVLYNYCKFKPRTHLIVPWFSVSLLVAVSQVILTRLDVDFAFAQLKWLAISILITLVIIRLMPLIFKMRYANLYGIITIILLFLPFISGETINGAMNWVKIGGHTFQPSEFAKLSYVIAIAIYLENYQTKNNKYELAKLLILTLVVLLTLTVQRDLGSASLYFCVVLVMFYVATGKVKEILCALILGAGAISILAPKITYIQSRIEAWINPWENLSTSGYQFAQGMFSMGTWGWLGSGLTNGMPTKVPYVTTDYIFVAIVEELGIVAGLSVVACYIIIAFWGLGVSINKPPTWHKYIILGYTTLIATQSILILGGIVQLLPLTGVTLPFVSYGGSSLLSLMINLGIVSMLSYPQTVPKKSPNFLNKFKKRKEEFGI